MKGSWRLQVDTLKALCCWYTRNHTPLPSLLIPSACVGISEVHGFFPRKGMMIPYKYQQTVCSHGFFGGSKCIASIHGSRRLLTQQVADFLRSLGRVLDSAQCLGLELTDSGGKTSRSHVAPLPGRTILASGRGIVLLQLGSIRHQCV